MLYLSFLVSAPINVNEIDGYGEFLWCELKSLDGFHVHEIFHGSAIDECSYFCHAFERVYLERNFKFILWIICINSSQAYGPS